MKTVKVTCDGCGRDISTRYNSVDYRLVLSSEDKPGYGSGAYTDMMIYPDVDRAHHFCAIVCLDLWSDRRRYKLELQKAWWDEYRAAHSTTSAGVAGMVSYCPSPSKEIEKLRNDGIDAMCFEKFPMPHAQKEGPDL